MSYKVFVLSLVFTVSLVVGAQQVSEEKPEIVDADFSLAYVPNGFDSNDRVEIVGEGFFANTCYRPSDAEVLVNHEKKTIHLKPQAYHYSGMCLSVVVPYDQTIKLGVLESGDYGIYQGTELLGALHVKPATKISPDDHLYAPVSQAYLENFELKLSGKFTNSCVHFVEVRTEIQEKVIVVLPITELREGPDCKEGSFPFERTVAISRKTTPGRYLLHVRSVNGKSVNSLVDVVP